MNVQVRWMKTPNTQEHCLYWFHLVLTDWNWGLGQTYVSHIEIKKPLILPLKAFKQGRCASLNNKWESSTWLVAINLNQAFTLLVSIRHPPLLWNWPAKVCDSAPSFFSSFFDWTSLQMCKANEIISQRYSGKSWNWMERFRHSAEHPEARYLVTEIQSMPVALITSNFNASHISEV